MGILTEQQVIEASLKEPHALAPTDLKIGDLVTFTNDQGAVFPNHTIIGFANPEELHGRSVYINTDCYWFPKRLTNLIKQESHI